MEKIKIERISITAHLEIDVIFKKPLRKKDLCHIIIKPLTPEGQVYFGFSPSGGFILANQKEIKDNKDTGWKILVLDTPLHEDQITITSGFQMIYDKQAKIYIFKRMISLDPRGYPSNLLNESE